MQPKVRSSMAIALTVALGAVAAIVVGLTASTPSPLVVGPVCGTAALLGPSTPPSGAITVPAGDNSALTPNYAGGFSAPNRTFWFAPGIHTIGAGPYAQIEPGANDSFIGAPGAIISGQGVNNSAFAGLPGGPAADVTIEYLTIENFNSPEGQMVVNHDGGVGWTIEHDTIENNLGGAGVGLGSNTVVTGNCLTNNGEYGFSTIAGPDNSALTGGPQNITLTGNEVSYNDSAGIYDHPGGISCGCSGGGKFWMVDGATITGNWIHDNGNVGLWVDTNNTGFDISGNTITNNWAEGIIYEISYNFSITDNVVSGNAFGAGPLNPGFPTAAIYISESGGDSRVPGAYSGTALISGNTLSDNWGGVVLWENANRYCSDGFDHACTLVDPSVFTLTSCAANLPTAVAGTVTGSPPADYYDGCRWKTQNVSVVSNVLSFVQSSVPGCKLAANTCGVTGLFSEYGNSPYSGPAVPTAIAFDQHNVFSDNLYSGPWGFWAWNQGNPDNPLTFAQWSAPVTDKCASDTTSGACNSGFGQDAGSTFNATPTTTTTVPATTTTVTPTTTTTPSVPVVCTGVLTPPSTAFTWSCKET